MVNSCILCHFIHITMSTEANTGSPTQTHTDTFPATAHVPSDTSPGPVRKHMNHLGVGQDYFAHKQGWGYQRVAGYVGRSQSTIASFITHYNERGTHENRMHAGLPKRFTKGNP